MIYATQYTILHLYDLLIDKVYEGLLGESVVEPVRYILLPLAIWTIPWSILLSIQVQISRSS
jgi:hypothetical protein